MPRALLFEGGSVQPAFVFIGRLLPSCGGRLSVLS